MYPTMYWLRISCAISGVIFSISATSVGNQARPPVAVVVFEQGWPAGGYERLSGFPELQGWLEEHYRVAEEGNGYRLYVGRTAVQ